MLNLVNQNKQHARKHTAILQDLITWRSYVFATHPKVTWHHIKDRYINTYTFIKYIKE